MRERVRCPACGALVGFQRSRPDGIWEKSLGQLLGLKPYRCEACLSRVLRRSLPIGEMARVKPGSDVRAHAPFASQGDTDEFGELIREIAATERRHSSVRSSEDPSDKPPTP